MSGQGVVGADIDALTQLERDFVQWAGKIDQVTAAAGTAMSSLETIWRGEDTVNFKADWANRHRPKLRAAAAELRSAHDTIQRNRVQQDGTSEADGDGAGGIPGGLGGGGGGAGGGRDQWEQEAADAAGVDLDEWDPSLGAEANRETIIDIYRYYGDLYLDDPDLQWAGMANAIGPSFAAGFFDLAMFRDLAGDFASVMDNVPPGTLPLPPEAFEALANMTEADLRFYETEFLEMQKEIFLDQAPMHEAYKNGGLDSVRQMEADGLINDDMVSAWQKLDEGKRTGNQRLIAEANREFLLREQQDIINDNYREMYNHKPSGPAFTYLMTTIGAPSIPGADGYAEAYPIVVDFETPGPERIGTPESVFGVPVPNVSADNPTQGTVTVETPFPDGNLANFEDRWKLIVEDTLPVYQDLTPEAARAVAAGDVGDRIAEQRLGVDDVVDVVTDWEVDFDQ